MNTTSQLLPICLSLTAAFLGAWAQYFYKIAALKLYEIPIYKNLHLIAGLLSFTIVLILFIYAFRIGGKMFVIYPIYATTYIWGGFIAYYLIKEPIGVWQIVGTSLIILGVISISLGTNN